AGSGSVGLGTASPQSLFEISNSSGGAVRLSSGGGTYGKLIFNNTTYPTAGVSIIGTNAGVGTDAGQLFIASSNGLAGSSTRLNRVTLTYSNGSNVGKWSYVTNAPYSYNNLAAIDSLVMPPKIWIDTLVHYHLILTTNSGSPTLVHGVKDTLNIPNNSGGNPVGNYNDAQ